MSDTINMVQAINQALHDAMADDDSVIVLGEDVADREGGGVVGITQGLSTQFGDDRVKSTPISEQGFVGAAVGAAMMGFKPVAEVMLMNFMTVCSDMVVNHAAKLRFMSGGQTNVPLTIRTMTGAGTGNAAQHTDFLEAWFAHTAGLKVVIPSTPSDAYGLMRSCIDDPDPCIFVENMPYLWMQGKAPVRGSRIPIGKASRLREGDNLTIIGYGRVIRHVAKSAEEWTRHGISAEVLDLRSVSPWDVDAVIASVEKTGAAIVIHEAVKRYGVGAEIASVIHEKLHRSLRHPVRRIGAKFAPVPFSSVLEEASLPSMKDVESAAIELTRASD